VCANEADGVAANPLLAMASAVLRGGGASVRHSAFADMLALRRGLRASGALKGTSHKTVVVLCEGVTLGRCVTFAMQAGA